MKRTLIILSLVILAIGLGVGFLAGYSYPKGQELVYVHVHNDLFRVFVPSNVEKSPYVQMSLGTKEGMAYLHDVDDHGNFLMLTFLLDDGRVFFRESRTFRCYLLEPRVIDLWGERYQIQWIPIGGGYYRFIDGGDEYYHKYQLTLRKVR